MYKHMASKPLWPTDPGDGTPPVDEVWSNVMICINKHMASEPLCPSDPGDGTPSVDEVWSNVI